VLRTIGIAGSYVNVSTDSQGRVTAGSLTISAGGLPNLGDTKIWLGNSANVPVAVTASGDVTLGDSGAFQVTKIQGAKVKAGVTDAQFLSFNGLSNQWVAQSYTGDATISNIGNVVLRTVGVAGNYVNVATDTQGRVTAGYLTISAGGLPNLN